MNRFREWYRDPPGRPIILAHRGESMFAPENTIEAAQAGLDAGADAWELDVQLARDGVPVVLHDESLARTTDVVRRFADDLRAASGFRVADFTLDEIRTLDAGSWFLGPAGAHRSAAHFGTLDRIIPEMRGRIGSGRIRIPTLAEALAFSVDHDWPVNVEVKPPGPGWVAGVVAVLGVLDRFRKDDLVAVSSFDPAVVRMVAEHRPGVAVGALVGHPVGVADRGRSHHRGVDAIHAPGVQGPAAGPPAPGSTQGLLPVLVYTINDAGPTGQAAQLAASGVAGLFTDDPAALVRLLEGAGSRMGDG